jgi:GNAT superfamily N-acetyltransferase
VNLCNEVSTEDPDFEVLTVEGFRKRILGRKSYDPQGHFIAVEGEDIIGSGRAIYVPEEVSVRGAVGHFTMHLLPNYLRTEVENELFARIVKYLRDRGAERISARADTRFKTRVQLLERLGFERSAYENHGMERTVRKMEEPEIPDGYRVRVAKIPEEIELLLEIFNTAFATRERYPPLTLEYFRNSRIFEEGEDQSGIFIAERTFDGGAVGMVIGQIDRKFNEAHGAKRGGTYSLAVVPSERRKGLGIALTLKSLKWIWEKGMEKAFIGVNWSNPEAVELYKATGYKTVQVYLGYQLQIQK